MKIMKTRIQQHSISSAKARPAVILCLVLMFLLGKLPLLVANENGSLEEYIQIALEQNKEILTAKSRVAESIEITRQAGILPDPQLGFEYFLRPIETRTGPQEASISLKQSIPWLSKLSLSKQLKENEADIARSSLLRTRFNIIRKIKEAYIEYGYLGQATKITGQILDLMNYLEGIARTNYTSGKTSYTDVLKIQIEIDTLKNRQQSFEDNGTPMRVSINNIIGSDRNMARPIPESLPRISLSMQEDEILVLYKQYSPVILAGQQKIHRNRIKLDIANKGFFPDLTLSVKTILTGEAEFGNPDDSGSDPVIAGLSFNIPLFYDKRNGAITEKQLSVRTAQNELAHVTNLIDTEIELILFRYRDAERRLELYSNNLIPKIRQELDVALETFQSGHHSILQLIDAEKNWLNFELARVRAQADMAIQVARLEELTGKTLADWKENT